MPARPSRRPQPSRTCHRAGPVPTILPILATLAALVVLLSASFMAPVVGAAAEPAPRHHPPATAHHPHGSHRVASHREAQACPRLVASRWHAGTPWPQAMLDLATAHRYSTGAGVTVAVVDTGVSAANPQLAGAVTAGGDFVDDGAAATLDCDGHGTLAAGIVAARPRASTGLVGVAPAATVASYRWTDGQDHSKVAPMAAAIRAAASDGVRIINVSSVTNTNYRPLEQAVRYAQEQGALIVAAAGNSGGDGNPRTFPAAYPGVLAVAAVDSNGAWWDRSQTSVPIAVAAPGVGVTGDAPIRGNVTDDGTSFAAPFVSGLAALVWARFPQLTAAQVAHRIEVTADDPPTSVPARRLGWGTIDPVAALTAVVPSPPPAARADSSGPRPLPYLALPAPPEHQLRDRAFGLAGALVGVTVLLAAGAATVRAGRRR